VVSWRLGDFWVENSGEGGFNGFRALKEVTALSQKDSREGLGRRGGAVQLQKDDPNCGQGA